jgi:phospholipase/carboxylesterase
VSSAIPYAYISPAPSYIVTRHSTEQAPVSADSMPQGRVLHLGQRHERGQAVGYRLAVPQKGLPVSLDGPRLAPLSNQAPGGLVVLIHGYGSNGDDLISLARMIQPALPHVAFVAPNASSRIPRMAAAYQWWPIDTFSMAERAAGAASAAPALDAFITEELERTGLSADRLVLAGFSQGTMMALHVGLRRAEPVAGILGISGMLVAPDVLKDEIRSRPPVLLIHGTADDVVPFRSMELASAALSTVDVPVETHVSPGVGHSVGEDGLAAAAAFVRRVLP